MGCCAEVAGRRVRCLRSQALSVSAISTDFWPRGSDLQMDHVLRGALSSEHRRRHQTRSSTMPAMLSKLALCATYSGLAAGFSPMPTPTVRPGVARSGRAEMIRMAEAVKGKRGVDLDMYRNIGIMAHVDAGKTTASRGRLPLIASSKLSLALGRRQRGDRLERPLPQRGLWHAETVEARVALVSLQVLAQRVRRAHIDADARHTLVHVQVDKVAPLDQAGGWVARSPLPRHYAARERLGCRPPPAIE